MKKTPTYFDVAFAFDESFLVQTTTAIQSLVDHGLADHDKKRVRLWLFYTNLSKESERLLKDYLRKLRIISFKLIHVKERYLSEFPVFGHVSAATYLRLHIPYLLGDDVDVFLYLDSDVIVIDRISELFDNQSEITTIAGVRMVSFDKNKVLIPPTQAGFNAGVLMINKAYWVENDIFKKCTEYVKKNKDSIVFWDQDILNAIFKNKWISLHARFNVQTPFIIHQDRATSNREIRDALKKPAIIHFTGSSKPWQYGANHPYTREWKGIQKKTGLPFSQSPFSIKGFLRQFLTLRQEYVLYNSYVKLKSWYE